MVLVVASGGNEKVEECWNHKYNSTGQGQGTTTLDAAAHALENSLREQSHHLSLLLNIQAPIADPASISISSIRPTLQASSFITNMFSQFDVIPTDHCHPLPTELQFPPAALPQRHPSRDHPRTVTDPGAPPVAQIRNGRSFRRHLRAT